MSLRILLQKLTAAYTIKKITTFFYRTQSSISVYMHMLLVFPTTKQFNPIQTITPFTVSELIQCNYHNLFPETL